MQGVFNGDQRLYVYADGEKEIIDGITLAKNSGAKHVVLVGGYHAYKVTDFLKKNDIPVLVQYTHNLPSLNDDDYDLPYKLPKLLMDAGLLVALQNGEASNFQTRNLPFLCRSGCRTRNGQGKSIATANRQHGKNFGH